MTHILISLLGAQLRPADYAFQNDTGAPITTQYCALALFDHFKNAKNADAQPDRLVVLGTPGSCWDVLIEVLHERFGQQKSEKPQMAALKENFETNGNQPEYPLTQDDLNRWQKWVNANAAPQDTRIEFKLIDYAITPEEQRAFIKTINDLVSDAKRLTFDLTHSLRHLSTLALLAAMVIRKHREIATSIYYGAFEISQQNNGLSPVIRLDGLLDMLDFLAALSAYDKDGDYAVFASLFEEQGATKYAARLREASFKEYAGDFSGAVQIIQELRKETSSLASEWRLIKDELNKRLAWVDKPDLYSRQRGRARKALEQGDLLRATVWGTEAVITRIMVLGGQDPTDRKKRSQLGSKRLMWSKAFSKAGLDEHLESFLRLNKMRHQFAHAGLAKPDKGAEKAMATLKDCANTLKSDFATLLPENPSPK